MNTKNIFNKIFKANLSQNTNSQNNQSTQPPTMEAVGINTDNNTNINTSNITKVIKPTGPILTDKNKNRFFKNLEPSRDSRHYPKLKNNNTDFTVSFLECLEILIDTSTTEYLPTESYYKFAATYKMLGKFNIIAFASNGKLEIFKLNSTLTEFEYSRTYFVNITDCQRKWRLFSSIEEIREFINENKE